MKQLPLLLAIIFTLLMSNSIFAGAWNKDKGHGYFQFSFTYLAYNQLLNGSETKIDLKRRISDYTFQLYGEYGINKKWNLVLNLPYKSVASSETLNTVTNDPNINDTLDPGELTGFSNLGVGLKYNLIDAKFVLTAQLDFLNNTHQYEDNTGLQIAYNALLIAPSILYGKGWSRNYLQIQTGLFLNSNTYSQNFFGNIEFGRQFWKGKTFLVFRTDIKLPLNEGTYNERNSVQTGLYRDNSSFVSPGLKLIQKIGNNFYLNLAGYGAIYAEKEGNRATYNIGLAYEW